MFHRRVLLLGQARSSLLTGLAAYWKLDEASGTRLDSLGVSPLTDNNTVTQAAGKVGSAAQFTAANSEYLSAADSATLRVGGTDFTIAGWFSVNSNGVRPTLIAKGVQGAASGEYALYRYTDNNVYFDCRIAGALKEVGSSGGVSSAAWHLAVAWFDTTAATINLQIDNGTVQSVASGGGAITSAAVEFRIGRDTASNYLDGLMDEVGLWKRVLTSAERARLYNGGAGVTYPAF